MMKQSSAKAWLVGVAVVLCMTSASYADTIAGSVVMACFQSVQTPTPNAVSCNGTTASDANLSFQGSSSGFSGLTDGSGYMAISGNNGSFGSMTLGAGAATYANDSFWMDIQITQPGMGSNSVVAKLLGSVTSDPTGGGVTIKFSNPTPISLNNGQLLALDVNNISLAPGSGPMWLTGDAQLSGTAITAPEPSAALLLGTGLLSLAGLRRRLLRTL